MKHHIELSPLQAVAFRSAKRCGKQDLLRIDETHQQIATLEQQISSFKQAVNALAKESDEHYMEVLVEIAREHGYETIPGEAEISEKGKEVAFSWETDDPKVLPPVVEEEPPAS